ncbi:MAG: Fic family protein [Patescibacteria group bacterium]
MAKETFKPPRNDAELKQKEAEGLWRAQIISKDIAESDERITVETIKRIHGEFFKNVRPEMAGRFRRIGEDVKKLECIEPPLGLVVEQKMHEFWRNMDTRLATIPRKPRSKSEKSRALRNAEIVECAAWVHHQITAIHPFCQGNGRMARIMNNVILRRFGLQPSDFQKISEDKSRYLHALCQIDKMEDYEPLKEIIVEGVKHTYHRVYDRVIKINKKGR